MTNERDKRDKAAEVADDSWIVISLLSGGLATATAFFKASSMITQGGFGKSYAVFSLFIGSLSAIFCFVTLLMLLWSRTTEVTWLAQNKPKWHSIPSMIWGLQTLFFVGTCTFVFLNYETGPFALIWRYSSSLTFVFGLGQIASFAAHFHDFKKAIKTAPSS